MFMTYNETEDSLHIYKLNQKNSSCADLAGVQVARPVSFASKIFFGYMKDISRKRCPPKDIYSRLDNIGKGSRKNIKGKKRRKSSFLKACI